MLNCSAYPVRYEKSYSYALLCQANEKSTYFWGSDFSLGMFKILSQHFLSHANTHVIQRYSHRQDPVRGIIYELRSIKLKTPRTNPIANPAIMRPRMRVAVLCPPVCIAQPHRIIEAPNYCLLLVFRTSQHDELHLNRPFPTISVVQPAIPC